MARTSQTDLASSQREVTASRRGSRSSSGGRGGGRGAAGGPAAPIGFANCGGEETLWTARADDARDGDGDDDAMDESGVLEEVSHSFVTHCFRVGI